MISLVLNQKYILFCSKYSIIRLKKKSGFGFAPDKASSGRAVAQCKCGKNETQFEAIFRTQHQVPDLLKQLKLMGLLSSPK